MKTNHRITSMSRLRKEKRRLETQIQQEKVELFAEVEKYKNSLWPFRILNRFKKTVDSVSENKLIILGAQLAYAALNTVKEKKSADKEKEPESKNNVVNFLKDMARNFVDMYANQGKKKEESARDDEEKDGGKE